MPPPARPPCHAPEAPRRGVPPAVLAFGLAAAVAAGTAAPATAAPVPATPARGAVAPVTFGAGPFAPATLVPARPAAATSAAPTTAAATPASPTTTPAPDPLTAVGLPSSGAWTTAARRARAWVRGQGARTRFALMVDGHTWSFRGAETTHSNSLIKATVLVAYLRRGSVRDRALTAREKGLLTPMIRRSANEPVTPLIDAMGGLEPLRRVGRLVGMRTFRPVAGLWGASRISAIDEARLFARLYSVLPPRHRAYALGLLRSVVLAQRWGMPRAAPRGWRVAFKSGWNGTGRVVQALRLTCRGHVVSVAVLTDGASHPGSITAVERTGRRLLQPLRVRGGRACSSVARGG